MLPNLRSHLPPGGSPTAVSQGSGMDFSGTGTVVPRAINPAVAQSIANVTASATLASNDISLSVVTDAMNQTTLGVGSSDSGSKKSRRARKAKAIQKAVRRRLMRAEAMSLRIRIHRIPPPINLQKLLLRIQ